MAIAIGSYISDSAFSGSDDTPPSGITGIDAWRTTFGAAPVALLDYINWPAPGDLGAYPNPNNAADNFTDFSQRAFLVPRRAGTTLFIKWQPASATALGFSSYDATSWNPFKLSTIAGGSMDPWISGFARDAAAYGLPILMSFGHEMNGNWYPWTVQSGNSQSNTAANFVSAWQHVWTLFQRAGATNVKWMWCANVGSGSFPIVTAAYPGDAYVDWIGWDGYNSPAISFTQFKALFTSDYTTLAGLGAGTKPLAIAECGCRSQINGVTNTGDSATAKADWLNQMFEMGSYSGTGSGLSAFPRVQLVLYYHQNQSTSGDWRLTSDANTQAAWQAIVQDSRYQGVLAPDAGSVVTRASRHSARTYTARSNSARTYTAAPSDTKHATITFPTP